MNSRVELAAIYLVLSYVSREYYKALREVARDCVASEGRERVRGDHGEYSNSLALARFFHSRGFMRRYICACTIRWWVCVLAFARRRLKSNAWPRARARVYKYASAYRISTGRCCSALYIHAV